MWVWQKKWIGQLVHLISQIGSSWHSVVLLVSNLFFDCSSILVYENGEYGVQTQVIMVNFFVTSSLYMIWFVVPWYGLWKANFISCSNERFETLAILFWNISNELWTNRQILKSLRKRPKPSDVRELNPHGFAMKRNNPPLSSYWLLPWEEHSTTLSHILLFNWECRTLQPQRLILFFYPLESLMGKILTTAFLLQLLEKLLILSWIRVPNLIFLLCFSLVKRWPFSWMIWEQQQKWYHPHSTRTILNSLNGQ